jgi:hypothetical protein
MLAMTLTLATPALAQDIPDFGSAKLLPYPYTDFEITEDGFLIEEGDMVRSCEGLRFSDYDFAAYESYAPEVRAEIRQDYRSEYEALVQACTEAGFPPKSMLPETGGFPLLLVPTALLVSGAFLYHAVMSR